MMTRKWIACLGIGLLALAASAQENRICVLETEKGTTW